MEGYKIHSLIWSSSPVLRLLPYDHSPLSTPVIPQNNHLNIAPNFLFVSHALPTILIMLKHKVWIPKRLRYAIGPMQ